MSPRAARQAASTGRFARRLGISLGLFLVLAVGGYFAGKAWVESYLRSDAFRHFVDRKVGQTLHADAEFAPLTFDGMQFYSAGIKTRGYENAAFAKAQLDQLRGTISLRRFFDKVWQIDQLQAERVAVHLDGTRLAGEFAPKFPAETKSPSPSPTGQPWLPNRVEISSARIREFNLEWGRIAAKSGSLHGLELNGTSTTDGWDFTGAGGELATSGFPTLAVHTIRARQRNKSLFLESADFTSPDGGTINAQGEISLDERVDLHTTLKGLDIAPMLPKDWRVRLHGKLTGTIQIETPLPVRDALKISGSVQLESGRLEALPVLDQIALFTNSQQFRQIALSTASGDFVRTARELSVTNFVAESQGLIRIEGRFTVIDDQIDGTFSVGISPARLQWLPGSQERVFTELRNGYAWAPMTLTGPIDAPREDLSSRLAAAAANALVEKVESTARDVFDAGKGAAKSALDLLMPLFK
ncbi:MAG: hypothetical protein ABI680_07385 [Chthoniobacteraceae bacterium]